MGGGRAMRYLKAVCGVICFALLASNVWSMSRWNEARGVYDDVCYLRQAHLFQRFGLGGFNTDVARDDDGWLKAKLQEIGFPTFNDVTTLPCHTPMPARGKIVLQYPPGTGMVLALFPPGHQAAPLYISATVIIFGLALLGIYYARSTASTLLATALGCMTIYLMINPAKASYSMAPTMVACALAGFLTARWLAASQRDSRAFLAILTGLVLGLSVDFRLPNLFLASGYLLYLLISFLPSRKISTAAQGICFAAAYLLGMAPTLVSNAINAGSPFATTYGNADVVAPEFSLRIVWQYVADMQFVLLLLAAGGTAYLLRNGRENGARRVALVTAANLAVNLAFFLSHPVVTPYYTVPVAMLSLWSLLFAALMQPREAVEDAAAARAAQA